jgi:signal transduction histidine kinase
LTDVAPLVLQELHSIAQEAVTNAFRHSQATEITVKLRGLPQSVVLVVTDNGRGFDVSDRDVTAGDGHWGIHGMKERAQTIGASFECLSTPNAGTQVIVTAPSNGAYTKHSNPFSRN